MSEPVQRRLLLVLLFLWLTSTGWVSARLLWRRTAPHALAWFDAQRRPLFGHRAPLRIPSCQGGRQLKTLAHGAHLWTVCGQGLYTPRHHTRYPHGVWARFALASQRADAAWPLPAKAPHYKTLGLQPRPDGTLGILYRSHHAQGPLVAAIAGARGWRLPPTSLPEPLRGRLLGLRWRGDVLEAVVTSSLPMDRLGLRSAPSLIRLRPGHPPAIQTLPRAILCQGKSPCRVEVAYAPTAPSPWRFLVVASRQVWDVTLPASQVRAPSAPSTRKANTRLLSLPTSIQQWLRRRMDFSCAGLLPAVSLGLTHRWRCDGRVEALDSLHGWDNTLVRQRGHFVWRNGRLLHHTWWLHPPHSAVHSVGTGQARLRFTRKRPQATPTPAFHARRRRRQARTKPARPSLARLRGEWIKTWRTTSLGVLAAMPPWECPLLHRGNLVPVPHASEHWLVTPTGCLLTLNRHWQRSDPLPLSPHLAQRARFLDLPRLPLWLLGWWLGGGPLCLLVGWLWRRRRLSLARQRPQVTPPSLPPLLVGLSVYLVTASWLWLRWWPLFAW